MIRDPEPSDRKMFAPTFSGEPRSVEATVYAVLGGCAAGATAAGLADRLCRLGLALGPSAPVTRRVAEVLEDLERGAKVERIPDGRYRVVKPKNG